MGQQDHNPHDFNMKALVDSNPEAVARFVLHEWHKHKHIEMPEVKITKVSQLSAEFEAKKLEGDGVLLVEGPEGPLYLFEIEFQSKLHSYMPLRSLVYLAKAKEKHWKAYDHLPVLAAIIYLYVDKDTPQFLEHWPAPYEQTAMDFSYLSIFLKHLSRQEIMALGEPALWPLALLTAEPVDRILVRTMFKELLKHKLYKTLPISHAVAMHLLSGDNLDWLEKEYRQMLDFFEDAPTWKWMAEDIRKKLVPQLEAEYEQKYEQKWQEEHKKMMEGQKQAEKEMLEEQMQTVLEFVSQRCPTLERLAKKQARKIKQPERFQQMLRSLFTAQNIDEAENALLLLKEQAEDV